MKFTVDSQNNDVSKINTLESSQITRNQSILHVNIQRIIVFLLFGKQKNMISK